MKTRYDMSNDIRAVFDAAPLALQPGLAHLRERILTTADRMEIPVEEALRWGQPSYLAPKGSTLRIGLPKTGGFAIYAHCATSLIGDFASTTVCRVEKNRAVLFDSVDEAAAIPLERLIEAGLTYHQR